MVKTEVEIVVNTTDATKSIDEVGGAVDNAAGKFENLSAGAEGATAVIDEATGGLATRVKNVGQGLASMGKSAVASFSAAIAGANGMNKALLATGIGALVVALGTIVAYWDDIVAAVSGATEEQLNLLAETEATRDAAEQILTATEGSENSLKLQGKSEREIRDLKIEQTNELIKATEAQLLQQKALKKSQIEAAQRNEKIAAGIIAFLSAPITILMGAVDALTFGLKQVGVLEEATSLAEDYLMGAASLVGFDAEETEAEADATIKETEDALRALKNKRDGFILSNQQADQAAADQANKDAEAAAKELSDTEKAAAEKLAALKEEIRTAEANTEAEIRQKELDDTEAYYQNLIDQAIQNGLDTEQLEASKLERLAELREGYRQADAEAQKALDDEAKAKRDKELQDEAQLQQAKVKLVSDSLNVLNSIAQAALEGDDKRARTAFRIGKALSLSQAVINTAQAVSAALAQTTDPTPTQSLRFANAALAGAQGLAQVLAISKQQFNPSGGAGGGGGAASVPRPSAFRPTLSFDTQGLNSGIGLNESPNLGNQIAESLSGSPIKAYVVSQEVQTQAKMNRKIRETATIG